MYQDDEELKLNYTKALTNDKWRFVFDKPLELDPNMKGSHDCGAFDFNFKFKFFNFDGCYKLGRQTKLEVKNEQGIVFKLYSSNSVNCIERFVCSL